MMKRTLSIIFGIFLLVRAEAQVTYQVKIMSWNILDWPVTSNLVADTTQRCPAYRTVVNYTNPDILVTMENASSSSTTYFLNQVMNANGNEYAAGTFINGYDTDNGIFYRDSLFHFVSNQPIHTALRDISHFTLVFIPTGDTIHIFAVHLKASQGYEQQRATEVSHLRSVTNAFPPGTNFLVAGDFNIYEAGEPAYIALLQNNPGDDGNFNDVWTIPGIWNNYSYAPYHTQSTRLNAGSSGSGGGMDDRFDMILYSNGIKQPGGVTYVPGTYKNIGNDGNHYNKSINFGTNSAVPVAVANALFNASDHLPVSLNLEFSPVAGIPEGQEILAGAEVYPVPISEGSQVYFTVKRTTEAEFSILDISGRVVYKSEKISYSPGTYHYLPEWSRLPNSGYYLLSIRFDNYLINKRLILVR
jgi:hypothetical protein